MQNRCHIMKLLWPYKMDLKFTTKEPIYPLVSITTKLLNITVTLSPLISSLWYEETNTKKALPTDSYTDRQTDSRSERTS